MPVIKAKDQSRVNMRREQIERFLSSGATVAEWCRLNRMAESTFYKWMAYFREREPGAFGAPNAGCWIEVSRSELAASTALAPAAPPASPVHPEPVAAAHAVGAPRILATVNGVELSIPPGAAESGVAAVMRAAVSL